MEGTNQTAQVASQARPQRRRQATRPARHPNTAMSPPQAYQACLRLQGTGPQVPAYQPAGPGPAGFGTSGESMAAGVPGAQRKPEYAATPSQAQVSYSAYHDANTPGSNTAQLGFRGSRHPVGSPDLQSPSFNPGYSARSEVQASCWPSQAAANPTPKPA